jgi:subtilisin family serine protease
LKFTHLLLVILAISMGATSTSASGWILQTQKGALALNIDSSKCLLRFNDSLSNSQMMGIVRTITRLKVDDSTRLPKSHEFVFGLNSAADLSNFVDSAVGVAGILQCEPVYKTTSGMQLILHQVITVAFQPGVSRKFIDSVNSQMGVQIDHELLGLPNVFLMRKIGNPHVRMLDLSNFYSALPQVRYAAPDGGCKYHPQGYVLYDFYSTQQWDIKKVIGQFNLATVWDFARVNQNVPVAVIDDGVEAHEDLDSIRVDLGYDFADHDTDATPGTWFHGMAIAGIIGAKHTTNPALQWAQSTGMISMNPHARIIPLKIISDDQEELPPWALPEVFTYAYLNNAAVINFSYAFFDPEYDYPPLDDAIWRAFHYGRGGKGTPVICAAGDYALAYQGVVAYPANLPTCLSVGAVDGSDQRWPWSMYGPGLSVVAPSGDTMFAGGTFTLDRMGSGGWNSSLTYYWGANLSWDCRATKDTGNNTNYDCKFGGTSSSTAIVSGVASLLISKNSNLTATQIYNIIDSSAVPLNSSGTGHGRADAFRAILSISHGDVNNDGVISSIDMSAMVSYLTGGGFVPFPAIKLADWNCDGLVNSTDLSAIVSYLTGHGSPPVNPCFRF